MWVVVKFPITTTLTNYSLSNITMRTLNTICSSWVCTSWTSIITFLTFICDIISKYTQIGETIVDTLILIQEFSILTSWTWFWWPTCTVQAWLVTSFAFIWCWIGVCSSRTSIIFNTNIQIRVPIVPWFTNRTVLSICTVLASYSTTSTSHDLCITIGSFRTNWNTFTCK